MRVNSPGCERSADDPGAGGFDVSNAGGADGSLWNMLVNSPGCDGGGGAENICVNEP